MRARPSRAARRERDHDTRRARILAAGEALFAEVGLDGASLRAIAERAGYAAPSLYFYFDSKEAIYAALLEASLERLRAAITAAAASSARPARRAERVLLAFYDYYRAHPLELDLGLYLFSRGRARRGLRPALDAALNARVVAIFALMRDAVRDAGATRRAAEHAAAAFVCHATGCLTLETTGRLALLPVEPPAFTRRIAAELVAAAT